MSDKSWLRNFIIIDISFLVIMGLIVYLWDPYNYYRIKDGRLKYVASVYIDAGIIRNADYDAAMIGSSVSQNFDVQEFRNKVGINLVKVNTGGITLEQRDLFYKTIEEQGKADTYYIEVAISAFNNEEDILDDTPIYLYDENKWNDYKYLFGYETWLRGMPVSLAYACLDMFDIQIDTMHNLENVDYVGDWYYRKSVGKEIFMNNYFSGSGSISRQEYQGMYERMIDNVDKKLTSIIDEGNKYIFYFPPYSAVLWSDAESSGYCEVWYQVKKYIIQKLCKYSNVEVYDFQNTEEICNLEHYRDVTHYGKELNDWMVDCFASGENKVDVENVDENMEVLRKLVEKFREENKEWLK